MPAGNPFTTGSAPTPNLAMQMVAPDLTADQLQLMRQQQIADILRQQALAPMGDTQVINGWAVKKSPLEGFSRLVAALAAGASQTGIDDRQRALNTALAQRMMGALNGSPTAAASSSPASSALSEGAAQGDIGPTTTNVARIPQQPVQPSPATTDNRFGFANVLRSSLLRDLGGDPAASAFWADTAPTDTAKLLRERNAATDPFARAAYDEKLTPPIIGRGSPVLMRGPDGSLRIDPASVQAITMAEQAKAPFQPPIKVPTEGGRELYLSPAELPAFVQNGTLPARYGQQGQGPTDLVGAVIQAESGGNPNAVSQKGAVGLGQHMPGTAAGLGIDPRNPLQSVAGTASYLGQLQQKYGDDRIALAAYNWGPGNVDKWLQNGADPAKLPAETQKYISTVMGNLRRFGGALPAQGIGTVGITPSPAQLASIAADKAYQESQAKSASDYKNGLDARVTQGADLNMRLKESADALKNFQAGGGKETRAQIAQVAQGMGMPDKVVNGIAGGDLASMQEFQKLAVTQAMESLKQTLASQSGQAGRMTQSEFQQFLKVNPNLSTDPQAIKKLYNFSNRVYQRDLAEQQTFQQYLSQGGNPAGFPAYWAQESTRRGYTNPNMQVAPGANVGKNKVDDLLKKYGGA